jgi:predicted transposase YbfD/YdcC
MKLQEIFSQIPDPRIDRRKLHLLEDILLLALLAVICGAESYEAIELFGKSKLEFLKQIMDLPNGIPSHDTIERVMKRIDSVAFERAFIAWMRTLEKNSEGRIISIDGKTLRGSRDEGSGNYAIHLVSAWCSENEMVLGQVKTAFKANEIKAILELLDIVDVAGSVVTIDAMGCQREIAQKIVDKEADYILSVKQNQGTLYDEIAGVFAHKKPDDYFTQTEGDHGRIEQRSCSVIRQMTWIGEKDKWANLKSVIKIDATREIGQNITTEVRYYISSMEEDAAYFNKAARQHWGIENSFHWVLDVQFREDESRKRKAHSSENFAIIRRIAFNKIKHTKLRRLGIHNKRLVAGWDNNFLLSIVLN